MEDLAEEIYIENPEYYLLFLVLIVPVLLINLIIIHRNKYQQKLDFEQHLQSVRTVEMEKTLQMVSREIHDHIGYWFSLAKIQLNLLILKGHETQELHETNVLIGKVSNGLRELVMGFSDANCMHNGIIGFLEFEIQRLKNTGLFNISFQTEIDTIILNQEQTTHLCRIIQECFSNILRHSAASSIHIEVCNNAGLIKIFVSDNGKGFDPEMPAKKTGYGINNMKQRAGSIPAQLMIESTKDKGTAVSIILKKYDENSIG